jgi:hypothetical protein
MDALFVCPDCELPRAPYLGSLCPVCQQWRDDKFALMEEEHQEKLLRRERRRMPPGQRFAEDLSDMVKAIERSQR